MDKRHERGEALAPPSAAEGVRIIRADEAQAALDAGQAAGRQPEDAPRFGDVPAQPVGPRSPHRFPLPDSVDPASAVPRPAVRPGQRRSGGRGGGRAREQLGTPASPRVVRLVPPTPEPEQDDGDLGATQTFAAEPGFGWPERGGSHFATPEPAPLSAVVPPPWSPIEPVGPIRGPVIEDDSFSGYGQVGIYGSTAGSSGPPVEPPYTPAPRPEPIQLPVPDLALPDEGLTMHSGSSPELPHWTDPPTGDVPRILPDRDLPPDEELSAWQALGSRGLRWRDEASDWDDISDVSELADGETQLGALDSTRTEHSDMFSFDEQFERLEDERSGQHLAVERDLEPPPAAPVTRRPQPAAREAAPRRPARRIGAPNPRGPVQHGPTGGGRDLGSAVLVGAGLLAVLLIAYAVGSAALVVLATLIATASALELYNLMQHRGFHPATLLGLAATVAIMLAAYWRGEEALPLILALVFVTSMLWYMLGVVDARPVGNVGLTVMAFVWVGFFGSYASLILRVHHGKSILLLPILVTVTADTAAFFAGRSIGQRPLAPAISPAKTWEGVLAGGLAATVMSVIVAKLFLSNTWNIKQAFVLGVVVSVIAPIGDLCESMVKRDLDLKDSGNVLPGHGGLLDRFDTLFFVLPAAYYLAQYLKLH